jgi:16S rRNA (guanine(966)-N(2))-methyltransferase RsmD
MSLSLTGGAFNGTILKTPSGMKLTRPTSGKVRQALFNVLRGAFEGGDFLDLFAGSGAVGLEALSRGARRAVLVESHPAAFRTLEANCRLLMDRGANPDSLEWTRRDARAFCKAAAGPVEAGGRRFAVAFADPPFEQDFAGLWDAMRPLLTEGGTGVVQFPARTPPDFAMRANRILEYGESALAVFMGPKGVAPC